MDREYNELLSEALSLDDESKQKLADALEDELAKPEHVSRESLNEAKARLAAFDRGELKTVDSREAIERIQKSRGR